MIKKIAWTLLLLLSALALAAQQPQEKVPDAETLVGRPEGTPLTGDELTRRTQEIAGTIRCPVCQGLAIADSPSEMARNMKSQVEALLARGYTEKQISSYFERSYGQFVLLKPKFQGVNSLVWVLPLAALLLGIVIVFSKMKSLGNAPVAQAAEQPPPTEAAQDDPYLARVREMVKGDKS
jgi:cytochrome c-type biogenesis protein CcmH